MTFPSRRTMTRGDAPFSGRGGSLTGLGRDGLGSTLTMNPHGLVANANPAIDHLLMIPSTFRFLQTRDVIGEPSERTGRALGENPR